MFPPVHSPSWVRVIVLKSRYDCASQRRTCWLPTTLVIKSELMSAAFRALHEPALASPPRLILFHTPPCSLGFYHSSLSVLGMHYISFSLRIFTHAFPSAWNASSLLHLANFWIFLRSLSLSVMFSEAFVETPPPYELRPLAPPSYRTMCFSSYGPHNL